MPETLQQCGYPGIEEDLCFSLGCCYIEDKQIQCHSNSTLMMIESSMYTLKLTIPHCCVNNAS